MKDLYWRVRQGLIQAFASWHCRFSGGVTSTAIVDTPSPALSRRTEGGSFAGPVEALELRVLLSASAVVHPSDATGAPPSASFTSAPTVTSGSQATEEVSITFTDGDGIDPSTITTANITVTNQTTGAMLQVTGASLNPSDGTGISDVATYDIAAPDASGVFSSTDNGVYSVVLGVNQVYDPDGDAAAAIAGAFSVDVAPAGALPPTDFITPPATVTTAVSTVNIPVTYLENAGNGDLIDAATIDTGNISVTGPSGALGVTGVSLNPSGNATSVVATYTVAAPSGVFNYTNDGTYTITFNSSKPVADTNGLTALDASRSNSFEIDLPSALLATISTPAAVTVAQPTETISVVYTDASGINPATIATSNILVTEQDVTGATPLAVTAVTASPNSGNPTQITATYTIAAPSGNFSSNDNGTYNVAVQANQVEDVNAVFAEPATASFVVQVPGTFGLTPSLASLKLPASLASGTPIRLTVPVTITNRGTIPSGGSTAVTLYLSTSGTPTGATEVASITTVLRIKVNRAKTVKVKLAGLPASLAAGSYFVVAQVTDVGGNAAVAASSSTVSVAPAFVDLSGALAPVPAVLKPGKKISATVTVTNNGNITAAGSLQVEFLARPVGTTGSADVPLATPAVRIKLASGASKRLRFGIVLPSSLIAGASYTLVAVIDPANLFSDTNLANNTLLGTYIFTVE
jgi:hypothetical protein